MSNQNIENIARQIICRHKNVEGGNDYQYCRDCELTWDYTKRDPITMLKMFGHPLIGMGE